MGTDTLAEGPRAVGRAAHSEGPLGIVPRGARWGGSPPRRSAGGLARGRPWGAWFEAVRVEPRPRWSAGGLPRGGPWRASSDAVCGEPRPTRSVWSLVRGGLRGDSPEVVRGEPRPTRSGGSLVRRGLWGASSDAVCGEPRPRRPVGNLLPREACAGHGPERLDGCGARGRTAGPLPRTVAGEGGVVMLTDVRVDVRSRADVHAPRCGLEADERSLFHVERVRRVRSLGAPATL